MSRWYRGGPTKPNVSYQQTTLLTADQFCFARYSRDFLSLWRKDARLSLTNYNLVDDSLT